MTLMQAITLVVIAVVDTLIIAGLLPWLINSAGTLGLIASPFVVVIAIYLTISAVKQMVFNTK